MPSVNFNVAGAGKVTQAWEALKKKAKANQDEILEAVKRGNKAQTASEQQAAQQRTRIASQAFRAIRTSEGRAAADRLRELNEQTRKDKAAALAKERAFTKAAGVVRRVTKDNESDIERLNRRIRETQEAFDLVDGPPDVLKQEITRLKNDYGAIEETQTKTFGEKAITRLTTYAAGFVGVHKAVALITDEMRKQQELIDKQVESQLSVSQSRNVVLRNLISLPEAERRRVAQRSIEIANATGVSETAVNLGLAEALSASGGKVEASVAAVKVIARFLADRPSEIGQASGTVLDLSKVTGTDDALVNLGLLTKIGELGRVVDPSLQAKNIAPALIGAKSFGGTASGSGALFAALTTAGGDVTGERTQTALINLAKQLRTFVSFPGMTFGQRVEFLQARPDFAEQFLGKASFETKTLGPIQDLLLRPDSVAAREFRRNLSLIPGPEGLRKAGERALGVFAANPLEPAAQLDRALDRGVEVLRLQDRGSLSEEQRQKLREILTRTGSTAVGANLQDFVLGLIDRGHGLTDETLLNALRGRQAFLTDRLESAPTGPGGGIGRTFSATAQGPLSAEDRSDLKSDIQALNSTIRLLEGAVRDRRGDQDRQTEVLEEIRDDIRVNGGLVGAPG